MEMTKTMLAMAPVYAIIPASDLERAKMFYTEKLGLEVDREMPGLVMFNGGKGTAFAIYQTEAKSAATVATFVVENLDATMAELRGRGVEFAEYDMPGMKTVDGVVDMGPGGRAAFVIDSEGNAVSLAQM